MLLHHPDATTKLQHVAVRDDAASVQQDVAATAATGDLSFIRFKARKSVVLIRACPHSGGGSRPSV